LLPSADLYAAVGAVALVGVSVMAIGFQLRREAEEFYRDHKQDATTIRAILNGRFHQKFAVEIATTIDQAAGGADLPTKELKEKIAKAALEPGHETGIGELAKLLESRDEVWSLFNKNRSKKSQAGGALILLGLLVTGLSVVAVWLNQEPFGITLIVGYGAVLLGVIFGARFVTNYSEHLEESEKFYEYCEKELVNL
jgi:hypothetical protein